MISMIGLFCFDGPLYKDINGDYCNITLTNEMFSRYFDVVDYLIVVVRTYNLNKTYIEANMKKLDIMNMEVYECPNFNSIKGTFKSVKFKKDISKKVKEADLIFARMPSTTSDLVTKVARKLKKEYLVEVGGCAWDAFWNHGFLGKLIAPLKYLFEKNTIKKAKFATYVTKEFLQKRYPNKNFIEECSNVYINEPPIDVLNNRIIKINSSNNRFIFGQAVNSINVKYKGEHIAIKILSFLKNKGFDFVYEIVGPGDPSFLLKQAEKYGFKDNVVFKGTLQKNEMINWYDHIDFYIQPSKQEGLPRSVIEAMSRGVPCIGSNVAGIPELLDKSCLLNLSSVSQMINTIYKIISDKQTMISLSKSNFELSKKFYIIEIEKRRKCFFEKYKNYIYDKK